MAVVVTKQSTDIYASVGIVPSVISHYTARNVAYMDGQFVRAVLEIVATDVVK
jgi:hypothetical protein